MSQNRFTAAQNVPAAPATARMASLVWAGMGMPGMGAGLPWWAPIYAAAYRQALDKVQARQVNRRFVEGISEAADPSRVWTFATTRGWHG